MTARRVLSAAMLVGLFCAPPAAGAPPAVSIQTSASAGAAPLSVTLTASGDPATYRWDLGDGVALEGQTVAHVYTNVPADTRSSSRAGQGRLVRRAPQ